jgi:hypothetical protein
VTRRELASELLDYAVRFHRELGHEPEGTRRDTRRRAGQLLRLVSQQINNNVMTIEEGLAWRDAARLTIESMEAARAGAY